MLTEVAAICFERLIYMSNPIFCTHFFTLSSEPSWAFSLSIVHIYLSRKAPKASHMAWLSLMAASPRFVSSPVSGHARPTKLNVGHLS